MKQSPRAFQKRDVIDLYHNKNIEGQVILGKPDVRQSELG